MPRTPLEAYAFDARFGKRSVFLLDPRLSPYPPCVNTILNAEIRAENTMRRSRLVPSCFSVCAVIAGKDLMSSRCIKGRRRKEEKREAFPPSFPNAFERVKLPFHIPLRK